LLFFSVTSSASETEVTTLIGYTFSPDLDSDDLSSTLATSDELNIGFAYSWKDTPNGQGQILVNYIGRDFTNKSTQLGQSFDTIYAHFNGIAFFKDREYITTVGLGFGATYFKSDQDSALYPSLTFAVGTRYEFSDNLAFITELRGYATLVKDDDTLFCANDECLAHFDGAIWFDSQVSLGLAYRF
jgi:hypothetical protein